jgi:hypothetical protein
VLWLWLAIDPCTKILPVTRARPTHATHGPHGSSLSATAPGSWLPPARRPVTGSISTSMPSRLTLVSGSS